MILGIGGVSRAGKGTLSRLLKDRLEAAGLSVLVIHQDQYIQKEENIPLIRDRTDWETPASLDFQKFHSLIETASKNYDWVIAEGLMCFFKKDVSELFDKKIFIEISWTTFLKRKKNDFRWGSEVEPRWYLEHIWTSYLQYGWPELDETYLKINGELLFDLNAITHQLLEE